MTDTATERSRNYVLYNRTTGEIVQAGVNRASCVEEMSRAGDLGVLYDVPAMPHTHEVDVSVSQPTIRPKSEQ